MSKKCGEPAVFRYTWPGKEEAVVCTDCADKVRAIANAIGMFQQLIPLTPKDASPMDWPTCQQNVKEE